MLKATQWEDEDADFLDDVIDFGDGRQYHIQAQNEQKTRVSSDNSDRPEGLDVMGSTSAEKEEHVTKEDRFTDDIDRSWPRTRSSLTPRTPVDVERPSTSGIGSPQSSVSPPSPEKQASRALFNERSNKLEPLNKPYQSGTSGGGVNGVKFDERETNCKES
jgi:serine/arginine repetitive matrix protein 2